MNRDLEKARERMDELSQDLYTRASYQKKNALFSICLNKRRFLHLSSYEAICLIFTFDNCIFT